MCGARLAAADPDRAYVAGGVLLGADHFVNSAFLLDAGVKIPNVPLAVRVSGATGESLDADGGGDFWRVTAGLEARAYRASGGFGFVGADAGYQHQTWKPTDPVLREVHRGPVVGGRTGYEGGGEHVRVRATLDLYGYRRELVGHSTSWQPGLTLSFAVGYRF